MHLKFIEPLIIYSFSLDLSNCGVSKMVELPTEVKNSLEWM